MKQDKFSQYALYYYKEGEELTLTYHAVLAPNATHSEEQTYNFSVTFTDFLRATLQRKVTEETRGLIMANLLGQDIIEKFPLFCLSTLNGYVYNCAPKAMHGSGLSEKEKESLERILRTHLK